MGSDKTQRNIPLFNNHKVKDSPGCKQGESLVMAADKEWRLLS